MCGLVGMISKNTNAFLLKKRDVIGELLFADALRGMDSTGLAVLDNDGNMYRYKRALSAPDFLSTRQAKHLIQQTSPKFIMGHNRSATKGQKTDDNAHPFKVGNILLAHNGTVWNHRSLKDGNKFEVDSEYITYSINEYGYEETLKRLNGSFALTWYNSEENTFNIIRNEERSLSYATFDDGESFVYASEGSMLSWICDRNDLVLDDNLYYDINPGQLYTIDVDNPENIEIKDVEFYTAPKVNNKVTNLLPNYQNKKLPEAILRELGLTKGSNIFVEIDDIDDEQGMAKMRCTSTLNGVKDANVTFKFFYRAKYTEDDLYYYMDKSFIAKVAAANELEPRRHNKKAEYVIYLKDIILAVEGSDEDNFQQMEDDDTDALFPGPNKIFVTRKEFRSLTQDGCVQCTGNISITDCDNIIWVTGDKPLCPGCVKEFEEESVIKGRLGFFD